LIIFLALATSVMSDNNDFATKFTIRCNAKWTEFTNSVLQVLVAGKTLTHQQAINFLKTIGVRGIGEFSDYTASGIIYVSASFSESFGGDQAAGSQFAYVIKQLIKEKESCATAQASYPTLRCADQVTDFLEAWLKLIISNQLLTTKNATDLAGQFGATLTVVPEETNPEFGCLQKQYDFKKTCDSQYGGVTDGARCFFIPDALVTWDNAWATCKTRGGVLSTPLTQSEFVKLQAIQNSKYGQTSFWTSSRRASPSNIEAGGAACAFARNNTYIFTNATDYSSSSPLFGNTWFRQKPCTDATNANELCIAVNFNTVFTDATCSSPSYRPVCQVSGPPQQYLRVDKVCLAETPTVESTVANSGECATACNQFTWCRSFNLVNGTKCQLFPWWLEDKPNTSANSPDCMFFNYFPW